MTIKPNAEMTIQQLLEYAENYHKESMSLLKGKNDDYTKDKTDALSNFQASVNNGSVDKLWQAVAVFHTTKFERIMSLVKKEVEPTNEALADTFLDLDNYTMFLKIAVERELRNISNVKNKTIYSEKTNCLRCNQLKICRVIYGQMNGGEALWICSECAEIKGFKFND